jgi:hypothetical protein
MEEDDAPSWHTHVSVMRDRLTSGHSSPSAIRMEEYFKDVVLSAKTANPLEETVEVPISILSALLMMLGDTRVRISEQDTQAAEQIRAGRPIEVFVSRDPRMTILRISE